MIYDYQDVMTKLYLVRMVKKWVQDPKNALLLLQNREVRELTESDLSVNSTDDLVWTVLYLIGIGMLNYVVMENGKRMDVGIRGNWSPPRWSETQGSKALLNAHIDLMMQLEEEMHHTGIPSMPLVGSLDVVKNAARRQTRPREPNRDPDVDKAIREKRSLENKAKLTFHSIGG